MAKFLNPWIDVSTLTTGAWVTHDVTAYVPSNATGIMLICNNPSGSTENFYLRMNGSTDSHYSNQTNGCSMMRCIGLDANKKFQTYQIYNTYKLYLVGYFTSDATFFTNEYEYALSGSTGNWHTLDLSAILPVGTVAVIGWHYPYNGAQYAGYRKNGSSDNRYKYIGPYFTGVIVGVDVNRRIEYITNDDVTPHFEVVGYLTQGTFNTNASDVSLSSTGSYIDVNVSGTIPANHSGCVVEVITTDNAGYNYALRMNGIGTDLYDVSYQRHTWCFVGTDVNGIFEGKISDVKVDFFVVGYFYNPPFVKPPFVSFYPLPLG